MADEPRDESVVNDAASVPVPPPMLSYAGGGPPALKTFRRLPAFEANLAAARLQAEGIICFVDGQNLSAVHPLLFGDVRLQVAEVDFQHAEQILATPARIEREDEDADDREDDDYVDEAYRCPKCRRKEVDLLPLTSPMRKIRLVLIFVVVAPIAVGIIDHIVSSYLPPRGEDLFPDVLIAPWLVIIAVLGFILFTAKRVKRCRGCGHEW